ncbi:MAG TPA: phosphatase PAP2 family protein [Rhodanobacter sp.]|jgi:PAP2 superfamily.
MHTSVEWIATHALLLWALLLVLAMAVGDRAWQRSARRRRHATTSAQVHGALRWHTAVLLLAAMLLLFGGIALALDTPQPGELASFDAALAESLHMHLSLPTLRWIAALTHLGDLLWVAAAAVLIALILLLRRHWQLAGAWVVTLLGIVPINSGLKAVFRRARPLHDHGFIVEHGWSFPSGHAFGAIVFYGMLAYVLLRLLPLRLHRRVIAAAVACVGLIGTSRILLQVHYFSDVLAGFASGAMWLLVCISATEYLRVQTPRTAAPIGDDANRKGTDSAHCK